MEPSERVQLPDKLERNIRALLPDVPFPKEHVNAGDVLTEGSLDELKAFLELHPPAKPWSKNPRMYALLRLSAGVGEEDITDRLYTDEKLLAHGISDYALPFSDATLPTVIKEQADTARRLLNLQMMVKSSPESMSFSYDILTHRNSTIPPFKPTPELPVTKGSFGQVESVLNPKTRLIYARKTMRRSRKGLMSDNEAQADRQWRLEHFKNEVEILQKLDNEHLVRFCGSYTDENAFALLVQPVAERTLHELLVEPTHLNVRDSTMLRKSFGCLAFGLAWLHSRLIRHKDIKPANILISAEGSMLFCDFGSAMDAELLDTTQTEGLATMRTPRYISPETHEQKQRNEASDVWSLGCVFLEMLVRLTGSSVDDLLRHIHEETRRPGPVHDICYWEGTSSDVLKNRIAQLAQVPEVQAVAGWTSRMVEKAPEARPWAAKLVADAQAHENAHPEFGHIGSCCAESEVPTLPEPRQFQTSLPVSSSKPRTWVSLNSPPTTGRQGPDGGILTTDPLSATSLRTHSTHSRVDSARTNAGQPMISGKSFEGECVFQAPLTSDSFRTLEPRAPSEGLLFSARSLRLYDLLETDLYRTTRRLVFLRSEGDDLAYRQEFWMPLCDTVVVRRGALVIISWSDCNHLEIHATVNGFTPHSRVYRRMRPNNTLLIHFEFAEGAREFASHISEPRKARAALRGWSVNLSPYATSGTWGFDTTGDFQKHRVSPEVVYTVQGFDCQMAGSRGPTRGLLVKADNDWASSTSRIYWLPPAIDIKLEPEYTSDSADSRPSVSLMDLLVADYKSNVQEVHSSEKDRASICQKVGLATCSVSWRFENPRDRHMFLDGISTWYLQQCTSVKCISKMGLLSWSKKGRASLLFWSNGKGSAAVTFRLGDTNPGKGQWITGRLTRPGASESYSGLTATIKLTSYCRDEKLDLQSMNAVPAGTPEVHPNNHDISRNQAMKIEFYHSDEMTDFQEQIGRYRRIHGDGLRAMHISSVSSDGYGVRASGPSLSDQTTSSSSRQS